MPWGMGMPGTYGSQQRQQGMHAAQTQFGQRRTSGTDPFWSAVQQQNQQNAPAVNTSYAQGGGMGGLGFGGNAPGQNTRYQNAGSRTVGSVNWGAVAGIGNMLDQMPAGPARDQMAQYLRAQGLMPTYNGQSWDQLRPTQMQTYSQPGSGGGIGQSPNHLFAGGNAGGVGQGTPARQMTNSLGGQGSLQGGGWPTGQPGATQFVPPGRGAPAQSGAFPASRGGIPGMPQAQPFGGGGAGGFGSLGGQAQGAISGILANPSPFSQTQQQQMRNRATSGNNAAAQTAIQQAREDAVRRGLNPAEVEANVSAIGSRFDRQGQQAGLDFDLSNAQATRQGLMGGLGAAQGFLGLQVQNEDSIRRYLAMLASAQSGNPPAILNL